MIEAIEITGLQAHDTKTTIRFGPKVTSLIGPTDAGKTSVIRAFLWLIFNRPSGQELISYDAEFVRVRLLVDGRVIVRRWSKGKNLYKLDKKPFKAFGKDVPEPIRKLLNLGPVNFQGQHDSLFWFTLSPGQVSRELNQIVDLGVIDTTLAEIGSNLRRAKTTVEVSRNRLTTAQKLKEESYHVVRLDEGLRALESRKSLISDMQQEIVLLQQGLSDIERYRLTKETAERRLQALSSLLRQAEAIADITKRILPLRFLLHDLKFRETEQKRADSKLITLKSHLARVKQCPICGSPIRS